MEDGGGGTSSVSCDARYPGQTLGKDTGIALTDL